MSTFRILPERSRVWMTAHSSVHDIAGEADGLQGTIEADVHDGHVALGPVMRVELPVERLRSGNVAYDAEMRRRIDSRRFPRIVGEATEVSEVVSGGRYRVVGELTFHGVTRMVEGQVTVSSPAPDVIEVRGQQTFDIRAFDLQPPRIFFLRVHPDVDVRVRIFAAVGDALE